MNIYELSKYIVKKYNSDMYEITNLRLQKILYYIQGYYYKIKSKPAFIEEFYNWSYGIAVKEIYFEYIGNGTNNILSEEDILTEPKLSNINKVDKKLINQIIIKSYNYSTKSLVKKTLAETPCISTQKGSIVPKQEIKDYFLEHDPLAIIE